MASTATVSVLFSDLVDSTLMASRLGPEAAETMRRTYFGLLRAAVESAGGTEVKSTGDGLMVVFSSVTAALACGVGTQQAIGGHNRGAEERLAVRVGISHGEAEVVEADYYGPPVVEAARLCASADGGQILTSELVRMVAGDRGGHVFLSLGSRELKGLAAPVEVLSVQWDAAPGAPLPPRLDYDAVVPFSGRGTQFEVLQTAFKEVSAGAFKLMFVSGEAGIGKTRLASELVRAAHDDGATVLYGRCDEDLGVAYQPWIESLRHFVACAPPELLSAHTALHGGELLRLVAELRRRVPDVPGLTESDPETERYLLFGAVAGLLASASAQAPVVLVLDDLHWADKPTLVLLKHLVVSRSVTRLLIVSTFRDTDLSTGHPLVDALADLRREPGVERLSLTGLDDVELVELLRVLTGHDVDDVGVEIAHALSRETDGNPFFVLELLRHLAESDVFVQHDGRWTMRGELSDLGVPQSIREVVGRRVARLGGDAVRVLSSGAVIGRDFDVALLGAISDDGDATLLDVLDAAVEAGIVSEVNGVPGRYTFSHALIEHTLYEDLSATRRQRAHLRVAEALEQLPSDDQERRVGELAYHWAQATQATNVAKAIDYARLAAERALAQLAPDEAVRWYSQALELFNQQPGRDARTHVELLIGLGIAQRNAGDPFRDTLLDAAGRADTAGEHDLLVQAALANNRGQVSSVSDVDNERVEMLRRAIDVAGSESGARARLLALLAVELSHAADAETIRPFVQEGIEIARRLGDPATLSQVLHKAHGALLVPDNLTERVALTAENLALSHQLGDPIARWNASFDRALTMMSAGDIDEVDRHVAIVEQMATEIAEPSLRYFAATLTAGRLLVAGRFADAEATANEILDIGTRSGQPDVFSLYGGALITLRRDQGRLDELIDTIASMVEVNPTLASVRAGLAMGFSEVGRLDEARAVFAPDAADHFRNLTYNAAGWLLGVCYYVDACARLEDADASVDLTAMIEPYADQIVCGGQFCSGSARYYLGLLATTRNELASADDHFAAALAANERIGAPVWSARTRIAWARMLLRRGASGDTESARELLVHSRDTAQSLGALGLQREAAKLFET